MIDIIRFVLVLTALIIAAELLAKGTENMERKFGQGIAGGIILGFLTALPETVITIYALLNKEYEEAVGSAIGGNVILFTLGIGLVGLIYSISWNRSLKMRHDYKIENNFLLANTIVLIIIIFYGRFDLFTAIILSSIYIFYLAYRVKKGGENGKNEVNLTRSIIELAIGATLILSFSDLFVKCIVAISEEFNLPIIWTSLLLTPIAAELEEKISGIKLAMSNLDGGSLAIVSFVGSKIENSTLLLGLIGFFTSYDFHNSLPEVISAVVANAIGVVILLDGRITKHESIFLIALYFIIIYLDFIL
ncbi:sodium:calcium antiporter [Acidianus sp. HS-5]|uniref:sodium:calcium antiporter n=1 Tax=Acidianus sp. HS-5 TaxID=2886040 RepID=UPI001F169F30|nr:sodium:calcium antiporter [Acidianus sp. HS-5]BDC17167.1 membrane protein [Acidianus sp. HS-5]